MPNDRLPLYKQIQNEFKRRIAAGKLRAGDRIPTELELMAAFNVSRITVANAMSQLAKEGWIYRIPGKGSFVGQAAENAGTTTENGRHYEETSSPGEPFASPAPGAETAAGPGGRVSEQTSASEAFTGSRRASGQPPAAPGRIIGFIVPTANDFFALRLIRGMNGLLADTPYSLHIVLTNDSKAKEKEAIADLLRMGAAGLIIFPVDTVSYNEEILALKVSGFPFVLIDCYLPGVETHFVCSDSRQGAELAVAHLWDLGHRAIAVCSDSPLQTITVQDRLAGYMDALKRRGALIDPALILSEFTISAKEVEDGGHMLHRYVGSRLATAYITLNSTLGSHIAAIARQLNLNIPGDLSIVAFDDPSPGLDRSARFTHIAQSEEEIGRQATRILLDALEGKSRPNDYRKVVLEPRLIPGTTSGPAAR